MKHTYRPIILLSYSNVISIHSVIEMSSIGNGSVQIPTEFLPLNSEPLLTISRNKLTC